jgi:GNAT superfamily N-acetyltransferase
MHISERIIEQSEAKKYRAYEPDDFVRRWLYTDNFSKIIHELKNSYKINQEKETGNLEYRLIIDDKMSFTYMLDTRDQLRGAGLISECHTILIRNIEVYKQYRGAGLGTEFMRRLLEISKDKYPHMSYFLFPYHMEYGEEELIRLGKWYLSLGFKPLYGALVRPDERKHYIQQTVEKVYQRGIRPLGIGPELDKFVANPQEFTSLQQNYFL